MARVRLTLEEIERELLPGVCVLTGVPTEHTVRVRFSTVPWWTHLFFFLGVWYMIELLLHRDFAVVRLPVVQAERRHWLWRRLAWVGMLVVTVGTFVAGVAVAFSMPANRGLIWEDVALLLLAAVLLLATAVVKEVLRRSGVHMLRVDSDGVTLANLHPAFVDALLDDRRRDVRAALREEEEEWQRERERRERRERERREREAAEPVYRATRVPPPPPARRVPDPEPPTKSEDDQEPWW